MNKKILITIIIIIIISAGLFLIINKCDYSDSDKDYIIKNVRQCAISDYKCPEETTHFQDKCGCGCININS